MYRIKKIILNDIELLPDVTETELWYDYMDGFCGKETRVLTALYRALTYRENYFQLNDPTMFGNPDYNYYCGLVCGILQGQEWEESLVDATIVIKKGRRKLLVVDKVVHSKVYYDAVKENKELLDSI